MTDWTTQYAQDVVDGKYTVNKFVRLACERHLNDLEKSDYTFDPEKADRIFRFFKSQLVLLSGQFEGEDFELLPWQQFVAGSLFGWLKPNGTRRFKTAYIETGKGSGKSPYIAGIGIYLMCADGESRAEVFVLAQNS